jgi:hypothetical protein
MTREIRIKLNEIRQEAKKIIVQYLKEHGCGDIHNAEEEIQANDYEFTGDGKIYF